MTPDPDNHAVSAHWRRAQAHLREAMSINVELAPSAAIHSAYYAMFRAALAVIVRHDGVDTIKTHRGIHARYGQMLAASEDGRAQARALKSASREWMVGDYGSDPCPTPDDATSVVARAVAFLRYNAATFGFPLE